MLNYTNNLTQKTRPSVTTTLGNKQLSKQPNTFHTRNIQQDTPKQPNTFHTRNIQQDTPKQLLNYVTSTQKANFTKSIPQYDFKTNILHPVTLAQKIEQTYLVPGMLLTPTEQKQILQTLWERYNISHVHQVKVLNISDHQKNIYISGENNNTAKMEDILLIHRENSPIEEYINIPHITNKKPLWHSHTVHSSAIIADGTFKNVALFRKNSSNIFHAIAENKEALQKKYALFPLITTAQRVKNAQQRKIPGAQLLCVPEILAMENNTHGLRTIMPFTGKEGKDFISGIPNKSQQQKLLVNCVRDMYVASNALEGLGYACTDLKLENTIAINTDEGIRFALIDLDDLDSINTPKIIDTYRHKGLSIKNMYFCNSEEEEIKSIQKNQLLRLRTLFCILYDFRSSASNHFSDASKTSIYNFLQKQGVRDKKLITKLLCSPQEILRCYPQDTRTCIERIEKELERLCNVKAYKEPTGIQKNYSTASNSRHKNYVYCK